MATGPQKYANYALMGKVLVRYGALATALFYAAVAVVWVLFSDQLVLVYTDSETKRATLQSVKGLTFVGVTSIWFYFLIKVIQRLQGNLASVEANQQRLYREIFNKSPEAQLIYHRDSLKILDANEQAIALFGLKNLEQQSLETLFKDSSCDKQLIDWIKAIKQRSGEASENFDLVQTGGLKTQISVVQQQYFAEQSQVGHLLVRDVSEIRRFISNIEYAAKRLDIARELSGMGCWEIDLKHKQLHCCNNVSELLDLHHDANLPIPLDALEKNAEFSIFRDIAGKLQGADDHDEVRQEEFLRDKQNRLRHLLIHAQYFAKDGSQSIVGTVLDLTAQKLAEQRLQQKQAQWTRLVEALPDGIAIISGNKVMYANKAAIEIFGATDLEQLVSRPLEDYVQDRDIDNIRERIRYLHENPDDNAGVFHRYLYRFTGEAFEAEICGRAITYEGRPAIQIVVRDLTESQRAQAALASANRRLASLSSKTLEMLERERKRIAGELHDDVGQSLTAIKLAVKWLTRRLDDEKLLAKAEVIQQICAHTLDTVRNLSLMLRPAQLDSLGLAAAIEWQADKLFSDSQVQFHLDVSEFTEFKDKDTEIIAFRVIQESLTNIVRHAEAHTVAVKLVTTEEEFSFTVVDDGIGFDVNKQSDSTGLVNMKERVELVDGKIRIRSLPGVGTSINVSLLLNQTSTVEVQH